MTQATATISKTYGLGMDHDGLIHVTVSEDHGTLTVDFPICDIDKTISSRIKGDLLGDGVSMLCVTCSVAFTAESFGYRPRKRLRK